MNVLAKRRLRVFWEREPRARVPLQTWYRIEETSDWTGPADVKATFRTTVDFIGDGRVIFDIGGNKYRLVLHVAYPFGRVLIKFVGTHKSYDGIDQETV